MSKKLGFNNDAYNLINQLFSNFLNLLFHFSPIINRNVFTDHHSLRNKLKYLQKP